MAGRNELVTLRFDASAEDAAAFERWIGAFSPSAVAGGSGSVRGRLYAVETSPGYLAWYEIAGGDANGDTGGPPLPAAGDLRLEAVERMRFRLMRDVGDSSAGDTPWRYIVHTDIPDHIVDEYNAWYDEEHLPRLVTVPGIVRARRYAAIDGNPRYLTAYDLTQRDAFESPAGLKARKTPWTEKMRSLFFNTRRLMCRLQGS
jgi:hypothetical protein